MSTQPITEDDLQAYVDDALGSARRAEIATYLEAHADVAARVESYRRQRRDLRNILDPIAEEPIPTQLNLAHMITARQRPARKAPWWMSMAAALLLATGGGSGWWLHDLVAPPSEGIAALAREAADNYGVYASDRSRPVELRADESAELVSWASEKLHRTLVLPDLSASGYRLMGGRMVATSHGAGLMLMYDNDRGTRLVLLTRPMAIDQNRPMAVQSQGDTTGFTWAAGGMGYSIVGPSASRDLHPLADDVRRQIGTSA
jgi:anti-sigma factor RsiW